MAEIRPATPADLPRIAVLARWVWLDTYAPRGVSDSFAGYLERSFAPDRLTGPMWVVEEGDSLLAWAQLDPQAEQGVELTRLYVAPRCQGRGLGARLLRRMREIHPQRPLWLRAWAGNASALRFYRREGATRLGETWFELDGQRHRNEVLGWEALHP